MLPAMPRMEELQLDVSPCAASETYACSLKVSLRCRVEAAKPGGRSC